jgi:hypothetical protein
MNKTALIGIAGLGAGAAIGYVVASSMGAKLPQVLLSRYSVPIGQTYNITCLNFPPNTQLVAPQSLVPPAIVNMGTTDSNGTLVLNGAVAQGPAGIFYIIVWNATNGMYAAMTTLTIT